MYKSVIGILVLLASVGAVIWAVSGTDGSNHQSVQDSGPVFGEPGADFPPGEADLSPEQLAMLDDARVIEFADRLDFQQELREFFSQSGSLSEDERQARAKKLTERLGHYENAGEVSAPEALTVRLALVQLIHSDEQSAKQAAQALIDQYQQYSERREREWRAQPRPEFEAYKQRETAIVQEVMAMDAIPEGKTRETYLRERLQQAREETMGSAPR